MAQLDADGRGPPGPSWEAFIGRASELAVVGEALDDALAGRGRLVLVSGEAGIGKTRFADQVATRATEGGAEVLWASCWEGPGAPPFWPWTQVVRAYQRLHDRATLLEDLGGDATDVAALSRQGALLDAHAELQGDPEQLRFRLFDSVSRLLVAAARRRPLLVVLDDLHAADRPSLALLRFLLPQLRAARLLLLGVYRQPDADPASPLVGDLTVLAPKATSIALTGLSRSEVGRLVAELWQQQADDRLVAWTHERTGGNPFFVKELLGLLGSDGGRLPDAVAPGTWRLPTGIRGVLLRRLARLPTESVQVLTQAAVLGHEFDLEVLQAIAGLEPSRLSEVLQDGVGAAVLTPLARTTHRYEFTHVLLRDALYEELPSATRARLHALAGEALERLAGEEAPVDQLAAHFLLAGAAGDPDKAVTYAERAGRRALGRLGYEDAAAWFRRALEALGGGDDDGPRRIELLLELGDASVRAGDWPGALGAYRQAADQADRRGRPRELARAALGLGARLGGFEVRLFDPTQIELLTRALGTWARRIRTCGRGCWRGCRWRCRL